MLVNDAAYNKWIAFQDLDAMTYEEWQKGLDVNLTGPMLYSKAVAPIMRQQGYGRMVTIASIAGRMPSRASIPSGRHQSYCQPGSRLPGAGQTGRASQAHSGQGCCCRSSGRLVLY
jgi:NAD(P)-dependent dehydrogenase (short-subunit alcohol dehydrogenase family)